MPVTQESQLKSQMRQALTQQCIAIRDRRRLVEEKWLRDRRNWMGFTHARYNPTDTAIGNYHIPAARRVIERAVVRCVKLLCPSVKWFEIAPMSGSFITQERVSNIDGFMSYVIQKKIKSRSIISQLVRCMILYGMPVLKTSITVQNGQVWPYQRAVDPFSFYIFPETAPTMDEAEVVFEDFLFSLDRYTTFVDKGIVDEINRADLTSPQWPYHITERLAYQGITDPTANVDIAINTVSDELKRTTAAFVSITEMWIRREGILYQVYIAWNLQGGPRIVGFFQSQYDYPLYRTCIHRALPGETYTTTQMEDIVELDNVQNDMFNQFVDAVDYEQGFLAFGGSADIRRDSLKMKGRAKWDFGSELPREVMQFIQPPVTSTNQLRAWQIVNSLMQSMGGAGTIAEGQPGRNMPRAGFAVNNLINLGMADIQDIAEIIEQEVLTPGLSDIYKVSNLIPDDQLMRIPGGTAIYGSGIRSNVLRKQDIIGDFEFSWVGSLQFSDENQRAQRLMIFLNMVPQLTPLLAQQGYVFNLPELIQMIWRSGIGERGLSQVVMTVQEMQMYMQNALQQQGLPVPPGMQPGGMPGQMMQQPGQNLPPEIQQMLQQVIAQNPQAAQGGQQPQQRQQQRPNGVSRGVPGLNYRLPSVTSGYVQQ